MTIVLLIFSCLLPPTDRPDHVEPSIWSADDTWVSHELVSADFGPKQSVAVFERLPGQTVIAVSQMQAVFALPPKMGKHIANL